MRLLAFQYGPTVATVIILLSVCFISGLVIAIRAQKKEERFKEFGLGFICAFVVLCLLQGVTGLGLL